VCCSVGLGDYKGGELVVEGVLQGVAGCCSVLQCVAVLTRVASLGLKCCNRSQCPAVCCSVLQCAAVVLIDLGTRGLQSQRAGC